MANTAEPPAPPPESTAPETTPPPPEQPELSLAEHEAKFGPGGVATAAAEEAPEEPAETETPRDEKGRFEKQAPRRSWTRINKLTQQLREAERKIAEYETKPPAAAPPEPAQPVSARMEPSRMPAQPAPRRPMPTPHDTKPDGTPVFDTYEAYLDARDVWNREDWTQKDREMRAQEAEAARMKASWDERVDKARKAHDDFEQVAFRTETRIPQGSLVDAWILERPAGAEILYHLQKNPNELQSLLSMPVIEQAETLTLLSQRLTPTARARSTPDTGAVARAVVEPVPRPPTPVRTGLQRAADEPPGDDASLAEHERYFGSARTRRFR